VDPYFASNDFGHEWDELKAHINNNSETLMPRMLSIDATRLPNPRVKFYTRCVFSDSTEFKDFRKHMRSKHRGNPVSHYYSTCEKLWNSLGNTTEGLDPKLIPPRPKYCLFMDELGRYNSSKLYIMCQEIPFRDSHIAEKILKHCPVVGESPLLHAFTKLKEATAYITE
jgi:hypothetical protein